MWKCLVFASLTTGCIITSDDSSAYCGNGVLDSGEVCDDGNNVDGDGCSASCHLEAASHRTTATWSFKTAAGASAVGCSSQFDTALLVSWKVDASEQPIGSCAPNDPPSETCYVDAFPCGAGTGISRKLPDLEVFPDATGGKFLTYVAIATHDRSQIFAETLGDIEDLTTADQAFPNDAQHEHGTIYTDGGRFEIVWALTSGGQPRSCSDAGAGGVIVHSTLAGATGSIDSVFKCDDSVGFTRGLAAGTYQVSISAVDMATPPVPVGVATVVANQVVHSPSAQPCTPAADCVTDLGMLSIDVGH